MVCEKYRKTPSICNTDDAIKYSEQYWDPINHLIDGNIPDCYMKNMKIVQVYYIRANNSLLKILFVICPLVFVVDILNSIQDYNQGNLCDSNWI